MTVKDYYKKTKEGIAAKKKAIEEYLDKKERQKIAAQEKKAAYLEKKAEKYAKMQSALEKQQKARATIQKAKATKAKVNPNIVVKAGRAIGGAAEKTQKLASKLPQPKKQSSSSLLGGMDFLGSSNSGGGSSQLLPSFDKPVSTSSGNGLGIFGSNQFSPFPSAPKPAARKKRRKKTKKRKTTKRRKKRRKK